MSNLSGMKLYNYLSVPFNSISIYKTIQQLTNHLQECTIKPSLAIP